MAKTANTGRKTSSRKIVITDAKAVLRAFDRLPKYRNGVKCNPSRREERYQAVPKFSGHLSFRDVIAVVNRLAGVETPKATTTKKTTTRRTVRAR